MGTDEKWRSSFVDFEPRANFSPSILLVVIIHIKEQIFTLQLKWLSRLKWLDRR